MLRSVHETAGKLFMVRAVSRVTSQRANGRRKRKCQLDVGVNKTTVPSKNYLMLHSDPTCVRCSMSSMRHHHSRSERAQPISTAQESRRMRRSSMQRINFGLTDNAKDVSTNRFRAGISHRSSFQKSSLASPEAVNYARQEDKFQLSNDGKFSDLLAVRMRELNADTIYCENECTIKRLLIAAKISPLSQLCRMPPTARLINWFMVAALLLSVCSIMRPVNCDKAEVGNAQIRPHDEGGGPLTGPRSLESRWEADGSKVATDWKPESSSAINQSVNSLVDHGPLFSLSASMRSFAFASPRTSKFDSGKESNAESLPILNLIKGWSSDNDGVGKRRSSSRNLKHSVPSIDDIVRQHESRPLSNMITNNMAFQSNNGVQMSSLRPQSRLVSAAKMDLRKIEQLHEQAATDAADTRRKLSRAPALQESMKASSARYLSHYPRPFSSVNLNLSLTDRTSHLRPPFRVDPKLLLSEFMALLGSPTSTVPPKANTESSIASVSPVVDVMRAHENSFTSRATATKNHPKATATTLTNIGQILTKPNINKPPFLTKQSESGTHPGTNLKWNAKTSPSPSFSDLNSNVISEAVNKPPQMGDLQESSEPIAESGSETPPARAPTTKPKIPSRSNLANDGSSKSSWIKQGSANNWAQSYFQDSFRDLLTLSQLPILSKGPISTAPSDLEPGGKRWLANKNAIEQGRGNSTQTIDDVIRYAYILGNGMRRKRDPLKALGSSTASNPALSLDLNPIRGMLPMLKLRPNTQLVPSAASLVSTGSAQRFPLSSLNSVFANRKIKPRGVMWDMATDPSLAVTVFHLIERASVALPLGFLLMPFVRMIRNPLNGINLGRIIPARASHRSVDYEELVKRLEMMDKLLSRALNPTHREATMATR